MRFLYWIHESHWNGKEITHENLTFLWIVIRFALSLLDNFDKLTENENYQFSNLRFLRKFSSSKSCKLPKPLKILLFVLYLIYYIRKKGKKQISKFAHKLKYYALLFWKVCLIIPFQQSDSSLAGRYRGNLDNKETDHGYQETPSCPLLRPQIRKQKTGKTF